jgi:hypothetical protein
MTDFDREADNVSDQISTWWNAHRGRQLTKADLEDFIGFYDLFDGALNTAKANLDRYKAQLDDLKAVVEKIAGESLAPFFKEPPPPPIPATENPCYCPQPPIIRRPPAPYPPVVHQVSYPAGYTFNRPGQAPMPQTYRPPPPPPRRFTERAGEIQQEAQHREELIRANIRSVPPPPPNFDSDRNRRWRREHGG